MSKTRIEYLDAIKAFAIYLVVCGHILQYLDKPQTGKCLHDIIYSFHMPLFMVISGYFASSSLQKTFFTFFLKKIEQLILPVIIWTILSFLCIYITNKGCYHSEIVGSYWFLRTLFACYLATWCIKKCFRNDYLGFIISAIIFSLLPKGSFLQFNWLYIFFWIGILFKNNNFLLEGKKSKRAIIILLCSALVFIITYYLKSTFHIKYILISISTIKTSFLSILLNFLVALSASLFIILLFSMKDKWAPIIKNIGMHTLGIYLVQGLLLEKILPVCFQLEIKHSLLSCLVTLLLSAIILLICNFLVEYSSKIKIINLIFYGNQYNHSNLNDHFVSQSDTHKKARLNQKNL